MLTQTVNPTRLGIAEPKRTMQVSLAEYKLLERLRSCTTPTMFMVHTGGDGEPKTLFAYADVKREELTR